MVAPQESAPCGDLLLPRFSEDVAFAGSVVDCHMVRASIARAFNSWSLNNRHIKFLDITEECEKHGMNFFSWDHEGPSYDPIKAKKPKFNPNTPYGHPPLDFHGGCPLAEIWVTQIPPSGASAASGSPKHQNSSPPFMRFHTKSRLTRGTPSTRGRARRHRRSAATHGAQG